MAKSKMDMFSKEEFEFIVQNSTSYTDCLKNLGYNSKSGDTIKKLRVKIQNENIDISHFEIISKKLPIKRCEENIFIENSTADQKTLRNWYLKGEYTPYICSICGQEPFWNGKEMTLILDHINGYHKDDRLENLRWVCPNCNQQLETTGGRNIHHHKIKTYCIDCGKEISRGSIRCLSCNSKYRTSENALVSREELKNLIRTQPFTKIGEKYGVSDNAVRKWCDKYNLPRKSSEIKKISNEEWEKI